MDRHQHLRELQWNVASQLTEHKLLSESYFDEGRGARWVIGRPGTFIYRAEIIAGIGGSLIVHGDVDFSRFAHYGDHADAWGRLCWMAFCSDVDYYVAQKASIGMGRGRWEAYDGDVARHDLEELACAYESDHRRGAEIAAMYREAKSYTEDEHELRGFLTRDALYHSEGLWENGPIGSVTPTPVVMGHLCLQRCAYLLLEKYGREGPRACRGMGAK